MKAEKINAALFSRIGSGDTQLIYGLDKDQWLKSITAGQILKGRILRVYTDNKYGVDFGGQERVVDSAVPLSKGDLLTGRVIGVNDHTVSMKIVSNLLSDTSKNDQTLVAKQAEYKSPVAIEADKFNVNLNQLQESAIVNASNRSANTIIAIRVGLYLAKLGLPITVDLVRSITSRILDGHDPNSFELDKKLPELTSNVSIIEASQSNSVQTLENLKDFFLQEFKAGNQYADDSDLGGFERLASLQLVNQASKRNSNSNENEMADEKRLKELFSRIFNASNGSHAQHRFQTLPIIIDGKLIEFDVAFFDQTTQDSTSLVLKSRRLNFSLKTEFGFLNLEARVVNNRLNISFSSVNDYLLSQIEEHESDLNVNLTDSGWFIENIKYEKVDEENSPAYNIVKHVLQQNSLDIVV